MSVKDFTGGQSAIPASGLNRGYRLLNTIDFSDDEYNVSASDVVKVLEIQPNTCVKDVFVRVNTVEGVTATADVKDYSTNPSYISSVNINSLGTTQDGLTKGRIYTALHSLHFVPANNLANASIDVIAFCEDLNY
ncbi:MAG: hypothetical protein HQK96_15420 [Nitrospirae bacterium]|nr:hypothetical protein [Nitrospirota bacterium]